MLIERPEAIRQIHFDYFTAGADCAITASYQATIEGFVKRGVTRQEAVALIQKSVTLAKDARDEFWADITRRAGRSRPFVAASVGPYGAFLASGAEYVGHYGLSEKELMEFHRPRMKLLIEAGAEMLACETIPSLIEAQAITTLLKEFPAITAWISFSARDETHISEGHSFSDCVRVLESNPQVAALGINCTSPRYIPSLIREGRKQTDKPILVYPNLGESYDAAQKDWDGRPVVKSFGAEAKAWYEAGARMIGGCCRTTPEDIRMIANWARPQR
jgi:homocysteine S-methyltransferase